MSGSDKPITLFLVPRVLELFLLWIIVLFLLLFLWSVQVFILSIKFSLNYRIWAFLFSLPLLFSSRVCPRILIRSLSTHLKFEGLLFLEIAHPRMTFTIRSHHLEEGCCAWLEVSQNVLVSHTPEFVYNSWKLKDNNHFKRRPTWLPQRALPLWLASPLVSKEKYVFVGDIMGSAGKMTGQWCIFWYPNPNVNINQ